MSIIEHIGQRILILDGAMGTMIQKHALTEEDYRKDIFAGCTKELKGNNECLNITCPEIIRSIHQEYIAAGADIIETNTFSANRISQIEYGCEEYAAQMAYEGARIARDAAQEASRMAESIGLVRKVWVAGSMGPTSKSLSLSPDASDPAFRPYSFDDLMAAYREQAEALAKGGVDLFLIETCFDALNVKAALAAIKEVSSLPVIISVSVGDRSGRTLTGQTLEAFYTSVFHSPLLAFGLNCSLGAKEMSPLIEDIASWCESAVCCYPNAGLPDEMGEYRQSPDEMADAVMAMAGKGLLNIIGGCCGTTPEHIKAISKAVHGCLPRKVPSEKKHILKVSGLEALCIDIKNNNFTNIGERTNVAGSRKFARLISSGDYEEALKIAGRQVEDGASVIDINMDDAMLDSTREMERFLRYISNDPAVAKAAIMIDSSHWETILAGLKNTQGRCIVNSISLKEGEQEFIRKARIINSYGAAMVVMAFDEKGQADTFARKIEICDRAYSLLTEQAGISPENIIFDVNVLSVGTGIDEHSRYAVDFIEAVRWIKKNLHGAYTSGGISNLSFAFRGNNAVREAMHSAFLYHAIAAGLDMAIVNPSMLMPYDEIDSELLKCVEDVIFDTDPKATERLLDKAAEMSESIRSGNASVAERPAGSVRERLLTALAKGTSDTLENDLAEALKEYGSAAAVVEGPLMDGMENVGRMFGEGKMFLPQVVKSAKIMKDAVDILEPYFNTHEESEKSKVHPVVVLATVKGDVHDIGKNITGIILTCNGFKVHDLGVMVDKETIISEAERLDADIIAVSGLITPSLFQMEELCREMATRNMNTPLMIGGATTSSLHTAVKLAPIYGHVFYGADASAAAVIAKKYMADPQGFEKEQHTEQERIRSMYMENRESQSYVSPVAVSFPEESFLTSCPEDIPLMEIDADELIPLFDWKMFHAIWGVRYGSPVPEAMELMQLRREAEDELAMRNFIVRISARFFMGCSGQNEIQYDNKEESFIIPFMRQENGTVLSLSDYVIGKDSGKKSPFGVFAVSVHGTGHVHEEGCCCPACSDRHEDLIGRTVRMTLAEAASKWLDIRISRWLESVRDKTEDENAGPTKIIKPAIGYSSCPDHTLKSDAFRLLDRDGLGIELTESYAMTPESSICGLIFMHPEARYPEIRQISEEQYERYRQARGMDHETARRFLGHLLK